MKIRILIVDDHKMFREGLSSLLSKQETIEIVAQASTGREALTLMDRFQPAVVVMDVSMPDLNGIDATRQITSRVPGTRVIGLSMHSDRQFMAEMFRAGASGYLLKDSAVEELASAIQAVMANPEDFIAPKISGFSIQEYSSQSSIEQSLIMPRLTDREREVLQGIAEGKGTKEIAAELHLSAKTIETHRQHLMEKLGLYSVAELTKFAIREGLTTLER